MALKRKHLLDESDAESSSSSRASSYGGQSEDDEIDIANALSGKKPVAEENDAGDDFEELEKLIKSSVAMRDKKEGTRLLKQTKGKKKISKGEIGGGSFQSLGE